MSAVDTAGDAAPTYSWAATLIPAGAAAPTFSVNNSTSANVTTATISQAGTYGFTVTATDPTSGATVFSSAKVVANFGLFTSSIDIGSPSPAGSLSYSATGGAYTTTAGGSDIGGAVDEFHYTYESFGGSGQITARVASLSNSNASAKAGPMFRDSAAANGAFAAMLVTPSQGLIFEWRSTDGSASLHGDGHRHRRPGLAAAERGRQPVQRLLLNEWHKLDAGGDESERNPRRLRLGRAGGDQPCERHVYHGGDRQRLAIAGPTVATAASANPAPVTSTTTNLSVLGADPSGEANLTYTWATFGTVPAPG